MDNEVYYDAEFIRSRINTLRLQKGVSSREMSLSLGKNETYISGILSGKSLPNFEGFLDICDYLRITPSQFFDESLKYPATYRKMFFELERLLGNDNSKIEMLLSVMKGLGPSEISAVRKIILQYHRVKLKNL